MPDDTPAANQTRVDLRDRDRGASLHVRQSLDANPHRGGDLSLPRLEILHHDWVPTGFPPPALPEASHSRTRRDAARDTDRSSRKARRLRWVNSLGRAAQSIASAGPLGGAEAGEILKRAFSRCKFHERDFLDRPA